VIAYKTDGIKELRRNGKTHFSPFIELGPLTSHLQPHFALVHAGDILASRDRDFFADFMSSAQQVLHSGLSASVIFTMLMSVVFLREAWGNCVPKTDVTAQSTVAVPNEVPVVLKRTVPINPILFAHTRPNHIMARKMRAKTITYLTIEGVAASRMVPCLASQQMKGIIRNLRSSVPPHLKRLRIKSMHNWFMWLIRGPKEYLPSLVNSSR
jgi:hypothetical protein